MKYLILAALLASSIASADNANVDQAGKGMGEAQGSGSFNFSFGADVGAKMKLNADQTVKTDVKSDDKYGSYAPYYK